MDEILEITRRQNDRLDEICDAFGREPTELRRSLFLVGALDAWASPESVEQIVQRFGEIGIGEFVLFWPPDERLDLLEHVACEVIPALRMGLLPEILTLPPKLALSGPRHRRLQDFSDSTLRRFLGN